LFGGGNLAQLKRLTHNGNRREASPNRKMTFARMGACTAKAVVFGPVK
jgi:hypothetical protein